MLIDEAQITVEGGHGGAGKVSFYPQMGAGPDGGNGGKGGDVYIQAISDIYALSIFSSKTHFKAEHGIPGKSNRRFGPDGKDLVLAMPIGTILIDEENNKEIELTKLGQRELLVKGGLGGRGNFTFKSPRNTTPEYAQPGIPGQVRKFKIRLRLIADFGLIGLPNSGKSSLLNELTNAQAKIGDYPFTTLEPNLGAIGTKVIADIPGLIEGASEGKGLGHKFLKHIEKVTLLIHCISAESDDPLKDYKTVTDELKKYNPQLMDKKEIILLTKSDLVEKGELDKKMKVLKKTKKQIIPVSIHDWESLQVVSSALLKTYI